MKNHYLLAICIVLLLTGCVSEIQLLDAGHLTLASTKNISINKEFKLLARSAGFDESQVAGLNNRKTRLVTKRIIVENYDKLKAKDIEQAINNVIEGVPGGYFIENCEIYYSVKDKNIEKAMKTKTRDENDKRETGIYFVVSGDVYGLSDGEEKNLRGFYPGCYALFKKKETGQIVSTIDDEFCLWQQDGSNTPKKVLYDDLIKIEKPVNVGQKVEKKNPFMDNVNPFDNKKTETKVEEQPIVKPIFYVGDYVAFKDEITGNYLKGEISTISQNIAFVEYSDPNNPEKTKEVGKDISQLTKIEKPITSNLTTASKSIEIGDNVSFSKFDGGPILNGKVTKILQNTATIEYTDPTNSKTKEIELDLQKLTKKNK